MRWAIAQCFGDGSRLRSGLPGTDREEVVKRLRLLRETYPDRSYVLVRLVKPSKKLQRELDEARAELAAVREAIGEAWLRDGASLAEAIERKTRALEILDRDSGRRRAIDAILRCTQLDLPAEVDEMVRARMLSRDGGDALTTATAVREFAAILATWLERGAQ